MGVITPFYNDTINPVILVCSDCTWREQGCKVSRSVYIRRPDYWPVGDHGGKSRRIDGFPIIHTGQSAGFRRWRPRCESARVHIRASGEALTRAEKTVGLSESSPAGRLYTIPLTKWLNLQAVLPQAMNTGSWWWLRPCWSCSLGCSLIPAGEWWLIRYQWRGSQLRTKTRWWRCSRRWRNAQCVNWVRVAATFWNFSDPSGPPCSYFRPFSATLCNFVTSSHLKISRSKRSIYFEG